MNSHCNKCNQEYESMIHNERNRFSDSRKKIIDQTQMWTENLRESTIGYSLSSTWTRSDLMIQQKWLEYKRYTERVSWNTRKRIDYGNMDWWEAFHKWWISGILDKVLTNCSNMTPWQVDTRKTLWVLGIIGWVIYGQYKFYTSKRIWRKTKIWLTILPIFGSQLLTWKDPITLFKRLMTGWLSMGKLKNKFGNAIWWLWTSWSECAETTVPAMQSMMVFNSWATAGNVHQMTQAFKEDNENWRNFYRQSCNKIRQEYGQQSLECFQATFWNNFDEEKRNNWISSFWVTEWTKKNTTVYELANNAYTNKTIIEKFLSDNHLKITDDPIKKAEFNAFVQWKNVKNKSVEIGDLMAHTDRFISNNPDDQNHEQQNSNPQNHEQQNSNPQNHEQQNRNPQNHEQQNSNPQNHGQQNRNPQNHEQQNSNSQNHEQQNSNSQNHEQQDNQGIEITNNTLKTSVEKWLSKLFKHFRWIYWNKIKYIKVTEKHIPEYSSWITSDILSRSIQRNWNLVTVDISDNNLKIIYDNILDEEYINK